MNNYGYASWGKSRGCVSEYLGEDVVETEEKRIKLPSIIYRCIGNEKSKVNSTFCRKEDVFFGRLESIYKN